MSQRIVRRQPQIDESLLPDDLPPVLRRVIAARSITSADELDYSIDKLLSPALLGGLDAAAGLLETAIRKQQRILIVGDFDADGATSCALCLRALRCMGAAHVDYLVPNRFEYGYGLTPEIVEVAASRSPDLIVTVDNGISSIAGVTAAKDMGIAVLITDHHLPGKELPAADAIVNPNLPDDPFPSKNLAGVGVAFYVMLALRTRLRDTGWFKKTGTREPNLAELLDLVALGTVADVVPLDHNNRILVEQGLRRIRAGRCQSGIQALLEAGGRNPARVVASDLGFAAGPRLNAAGRLDDMSLGIECLLTDSESQARKMAMQLDNLNRNRKAIEIGMRQQAFSAIDKLSLNEKSLPAGLCLFDANWHQGVVGILASRIKEKFHRPVIAFACTENGELKGSARSVPGLHIRDALDAVATRYPDLVTKFGGHAMAAGLSLDKNRLEEFSTAFADEVSHHLDAMDLNGTLYSDGELSGEEFSLETALLLRNAGPWGQGYPAPLFDGHFSVVDKRIVGGRHLKMIVSDTRGNHQIDAIAFNRSELPSPSDSLHFAYRLEVNEYRGVMSPQLIIEAVSV